LRILTTACWTILSPPTPQFESFSRRLDGRGCGDKRDRHQSALSAGKGDIGRELQDALSPHEVGLEVRAKRIAALADGRDADAGLAEERVIDGHTEGSLRRELLQHGATNDGEDLLDGRRVWEKSR